MKTVILRTVALSADTYAELCMLHMEHPDNHALADIIQQFQHFSVDAPVAPFATTIEHLRHYTAGLPPTMPVVINNKPIQFTITDQTLHLHN